MPLLLTRPVSRAFVLNVKIAVGLGVYLSTSAVPILLYAIWAATPGTHASPFLWSMTWPMWQCWLGLSAIYLGALLTGLRPGRWWGTRWWPLAGAIIVAFLLAVDGEASVATWCGVALALAASRAVEAWHAE